MLGGAVCVVLVVWMLMPGQRFVERLFLFVCAFVAVALTLAVVRAT